MLLATKIYGTDIFIESEAAFVVPLFTAEGSACLIWHWFFHWMLFLMQLSNGAAPPPRIEDPHDCKNILSTTVLWSNFFHWQYIFTIVWSHKNESKQIPLTSCPLYDRLIVAAVIGWMHFRNSRRGFSTCIRYHLHWSEAVNNCIIHSQIWSEYKTKKVKRHFHLWSQVSQEWSLQHIHYTGCEGKWSAVIKLRCVVH